MLRDFVNGSNWNVSSLDIMEVENLSAHIFRKTQNHYVETECSQQGSDDFMGRGAKCCEWNVCLRILVWWEKKRKSYQIITDSEMTFDSHVKKLLKMSS